MKVLNLFDRYREEMHRSNSLPIEKQFLLECGIINILWQSWCQFWRVYWLSLLMGGLDISGNKIVKHSSYLSEQHAVNYLKNGCSGDPLPHYREPTWGSRDTIEKIALRLYRLDPQLNPQVLVSKKANLVLSAVGLIGNSLDHFQLVRNASIHIDSHQMRSKVPTVYPYYSVSNVKYPTEILRSTKLEDNKIAYDSWRDDFKVMIELLL